MIMAFVERMEERRRNSRVETYLKYFRRQMGLTQQELADATEIPVKTIQQYEQGQKSINKAASENVIKLAKVLCCSPEQLLE